MGFELHEDLKRDGIVLGQFELSLLLMIDDAAYPWFVLVPQRANVSDMHQLDVADHDQLTRESRSLSTSLMAAFNGKKMNVAALGNMTPQLHIHHIVRFENDSAWPGPIWGVQPLTPMREIELKTRIERLKLRMSDGINWCA